jgi:hypothetical protein
MSIYYRGKYLVTLVRPIFDIKSCNEPTKCDFSCHNPINDELAMNWTYSTRYVLGPAYLESE